ncbi:hypothetical protein GBAR_LOCUS5501 [Geodia barretti]|uniref:Uncharacterized protein n=1 Tax=Geodia barretti TaxID=519541 RepID=A0AA35RBK4_GEOBA|nr:hypothetical protein GBAR_LOCUS5501 [Geodia barretti]
MKKHRGGRLWDIKRRTYCTGEWGDSDRMSLSTPCWSVRCLGRSGWRESAGRERIASN